MSRRTSVLLLASWLTVPGLALAQEAEEQELTPEKIAAIRRDEQKAKDKVNEAYGNRKSSEMSTDERRQVIQEQQQAGQKVMEKHGVSDKEYSRHVARMGREETEAVARAEKALEAKEKAAREAEQKKKAEKELPEEVPIQQGISDENPVELEASEDAASVVEQGLPPGETGAEGTAEGATESAPAGAGDVPAE
ncbi:hypothetical protein [Hyalangium rubrum]|uniref:DUF4148 domain-containing protein n=1 Tax=Hyalangium rubrum TaxID=3103134 RepID=A0ABU5HJX1_9BACT|nr:hypothetical protein [Hyalangium sp. s54d21]MDY7233204.1 hypothetical protein [Hyalangium sp. s54d21]